MAMLLAPVDPAGADTLLACTIKFDPAANGIAAIEAAAGSY